MARILCIEDERDLRECLVEELQDAGHTTLEAVDGLQGLEAIRKEGPDLVVSDICMPRMDGHRLLRTLREQHPEFDELPFVFLSAVGDREAIIEGRQLGADAYLTKPIDFQMLLVEIESRLAQVARMMRRKEEELARLYKAMARKAGSEPQVAEPERASEEPLRLEMTQFHARGGQPVPLFLCAPVAGPELGTPAQDLQLLRTAGMMIKNDQNGGAQRFTIVDLHSETALQDTQFQRWRAACEALPLRVRDDLGVRVIGLTGPRIVAHASTLAGALGKLSRLQVIEVDRHGLEILAGMTLAFRFVSIDAALLADPALPVRARARSYIAALREKGVKVILRNCASDRLRKLNQDLAADFFC